LSSQATNEPPVRNGIRKLCNNKITMDTDRIGAKRYKGIFLVDHDIVFVRVKPSFGYELVRTREAASIMVDGVLRSRP
jgi:hypothetical protein